MHDSKSQETAQRPLMAVSIGHLSREGAWGLDAPRSYLVPVLFWFTCGQGRISVNGTIRGYTPHNAIYLPANTAHACETSSRVQGTVLFFGGRTELPGPSEPLHLRLSTIQQQAEMNQLVECFRQESTSVQPFADQILYHRAALILLYLAQKALQDPSRQIMSASVPATRQIAYRSQS